MFFAAAAVVVAVLKKINFTSISRDGRDFSICCAFFSLFFCHLQLVFDVQPFSFSASFSVMLFPLHDLCLFSSFFLLL